MAKFGGKKAALGRIRAIYRYVGEEYDALHRLITKRKGKRNVERTSRDILDVFVIFGAWQSEAEEIHKEYADNGGGGDSFHEAMEGIWEFVGNGGTKAHEWITRLYDKDYVAVDSYLRPIEWIPR